MFWLYKNLFFFLKNQNFYVQNFYLLVNFNLFLIFKFNKSLNFFNTPFKKESFIFYKNFNFKCKNNFIFKYFKYFNKLLFFKNNSIRLNQINYYGSINNYKFYYFNNYNYFFYKKLINLIFDINKQNNNFIILDKSYKNVFPLFNYLFNYKNIIIYKKYFFINPKSFTFNNWHYYYSKFLEKFRIILILIFDFYFFNKFFQIIKNVNLPISSLVPINNQNTFIDYPIYTSYYFSFEKFLFLNFITQAVLISFNYKSYNSKIKFLKIFYSFASKINY